ncbi:MAG TPA: hypothetical protein VL122_07465 [Nitrospirota bacterium]|nr:hypothetical protein [Nitrospirota bacterium]
MAQTTEAATTPDMAPGKAATEPTVETTVSDDFPKSPIPDFLHEKEEPSQADRSPFDNPASQAEPLPARKPELPPQTELQSEKSDIARPEQEKMPESETMTTAMTVEMAEPEPGMTPALAVREDVHPAFEQQPEPQPDTETLTMQVAEPEPQPGVAAVGEAIEAAQPAPGQKPEPHLKPDAETVKEPVAAAEPEPVVTMAVEKAEAAQLELERQPEPQQEPKTEMAVEPAAVAAERTPVSTSQSETPSIAQHDQKPEQETKAAVMPSGVAQPETPSEPKPAVIPTARHQPAQNVPPFKTGSQPSRRTSPAVVPAAQALKKESSHRPSSSAVLGASPTKSPRSGNKAIIMVAAIIILVLGGFGAYMFLRSPAPSSNDSAAHMISAEGLRITNAVGSLEPNGDLLISGVVENSTDKPQPAWLVVVDIYDAKGTVINKIKLLSGKQLYSPSDYAILAKRGEHVQEMKANALRGQGTVIPPEDKVPFEIRYLQPPAGITSFSATLQPFDPARLSKETEDQTK